VLTGVNVRAAIGITALAEGVTCIAAMLTYVLAGKQVDLMLALPLSIGVALSTPVAAVIVKKLKTKHLKLVIGVCTLIMGALMLLKTTRVL